MRARIVIPVPGVKSVTGAAPNASPSGTQEKFVTTNGLLLISIYFLAILALTKPVGA